MFYLFVDLIFAEDEVKTTITKADTAVSTCVRFMF